MSEYTHLSYHLRLLRCVCIWQYEDIYMAVYTSSCSGAYVLTYADVCSRMLTYPPQVRMYSHIHVLILLNMCLILLYIQLYMCLIVLYTHLSYHLRLPGYVC
jgi:hypothetical protein